MLTFHSFRASGSTYSRLHHRLPKSFNADAISSLHFFEIDTRRKPVFWTLRNYVSNSRILNDFQISSHYMTGCRINKFGIFTISWLRSVCMNVKIRNKFIEIKYSVSNGLVIFITNYWWFRILEISRYRWSNGSVLKDTNLFFLALKILSLF